MSPNTLPHLLTLVICLLASLPCSTSATHGDLDQLESALRSTYPIGFETDPDAGVFAHTEPGIVHQWGPASRYHATIVITRYYGNQQERNQQMAIALMPRKAKLLIPAGDCDDLAKGLPYAPEIDRVFFNGREVGKLTGKDNLWLLNTFEIPCEEINFPESPGSIGVNELEIIIDSANSEKRWYLELYSMALQIYAPRPIFLVHGWTPNGPTALDFMHEVIRNSWGIPCEMGSAPMDNSPETNGGLLADQLAGHANSYHVRMFNIIAHSKGGLDSRVLIDTAGNASEHVKELHQVATPNAGSYLANILAHPKNLLEKALSKAAQAAEPAYRKITPGLLSLTPENCQVFNQKFINPVASIATVTGRIGNGHQYSKLGRFSYGHDFDSPDWRRQGDGIVSVISAHALNTQVSNSPLTSVDSRFAHNNIILVGSGNVLASFTQSLLELPPSIIPKNPDLRSASASAAGVTRIIRRPSATEAAIESLQKTMEAMPPPPAELRTITPSFQPDHTLIKDAIVEPGQTVDIRFELLENTEHAAFLCTRTNSDTRIALVQPDGTALTFPEAPALEEDEIANLFGIRMLERANLPKGVYRVRVENPSPLDICVSAACQFSGIAPEPKIRLEDTEQHQIMVWLERGDEVIQADNLPLRCRYMPWFLPNGNDNSKPPSPEPTTIVLNYAGNGLYTANFPELPEGEYEFQAEWLDQFGEAASETKVRYGNYLVTGNLQPLSSSATKIPGKYSDYCFSYFSNPTMCKAIRLPVDATVSRPGDYAVSAILCSPDGTEIVQGGCNVTATEAGKLHFDIEFDGKAIYGSKADGKYVVRQLTLEYHAPGGSFKLLDTIQSHPIGTFHWRDFADTPFHLADAEDWLETVCPDGREHRVLLHIRFHVEVPTDLENNFDFTATLRTSAGQIIGSTQVAPAFQGPENLGSGRWPVEMVFDTGDLLEAGVPGPFTLFNICALRKGPIEYFQFGEEIETQPYQLDQFATPMTTFSLRSSAWLALQTTPTHDVAGTYTVRFTVTRNDAIAQNWEYLKCGEPLAGPFGIALEDEENIYGIRIIGAQPANLVAGEFQYLDCDAEVRQQLRNQGNHDDCLDDGESIALTFQFTCDFAPGNEPPPFALLGRIMAPQGRYLRKKLIVNCLSTDLDQDFQISAEEADAARQKWRDGGLSHHILLQTLEFHQAPGYRFNPLLNDFEPSLNP